MFVSAQRQLELLFCCGGAETNLFLARRRETFYTQVTMAEATLLEQMRKVVREEVEAAEKRPSTKLDKVQESVDKVQNVMVEHYKKLENRVTQIEADSGFPKSH